MEKLSFSQGVYNDPKVIIPAKLVLNLIGGRESRPKTLDSESSPE
jgi:hypothetical protein